MVAAESRVVTAPDAGYWVPGNNSDEWVFVGRLFTRPDGERHVLRFQKSVKVFNNAPGSVDALLVRFMREQGVSHYHIHRDYTQDHYSIPVAALADWHSELRGTSTVKVVPVSHWEFTQQTAGVHYQKVGHYRLLSTSPVSWERHS
jgi:hypothetical protein